jgi:subtilisin family serine protease
MTNRTTTLIAIKRWLFASFMAFAPLFVLAEPALSIPECTASIPGKYIVDFKDAGALKAFFRTTTYVGIDALRRAPHTQGVDTLLPMVQLGKTALLLDLSETEAYQLLRDRLDLKILSVERDAPVSLFLTPTDSEFGQQYALRAIHAEAAWEIASPLKASALKVAVVDSGIDAHTGIPQVKGDSDNFGHGTHIAGTIGAGEGDGGTVGVVWNIQLFGLRFTGSNGKGNISDAVDKIDAALTYEPNIVVMAWGTRCKSSALERRIAANPTVLFVAAAGNDGLDLHDHPVYPGAFDADNLITVMATSCPEAGTSEPVPDFSSFGEHVDIAAPGVADASASYCRDDCKKSEHGILSTVRQNRYCCMLGTSMSAAFVAGGAALVWSHTPSLNAAGVKQCLVDSAFRLNSLAGKCDKCGRLDLINAVMDGENQPASCKPVTAAGPRSGSSPPTP